MFYSLNTFECIGGPTHRILEDFLRSSERRKYVGGIRMLDESTFMKGQAIPPRSYHAQRTKSTKIVKKVYNMLGESCRLKSLSNTVPAFEFLEKEPESKEDKLSHPKFWA